MKNYKKYIVIVFLVMFVVSGCDMKIEKREDSSKDNENTVSVTSKLDSSKNDKKDDNEVRNSNEVDEIIEISKSEFKNVKNIEIKSGFTDINIISENRYDAKLHFYGTASPSIWGNKDKITHKIVSEDLNIDIHNKNGSNNESNNGNFNNDLILDIYIPENCIEVLDIVNGVGNLYINNLKAEEVNFTIGVGKVAGKNFSGDLEGEIGVGDVVVEFSDFDNGEIDFIVGTGNSKITIPENSGFKIEAITGVGDLDTDFDIDNEIAKDIMNFIAKSLKGTYGNGESEIKIETGVGEIEILKK